MNPLQIFEKHPTADAYRVGGAFTPYAIISTEKRFTDAELAAEYWFAYSGYIRECSNVLYCQERYREAAGESFQEAMQKCEILYRFATLPHFDEEAATNAGS